MSYEHGTNFYLPTITTRGVIVFPDNDVVIEVGRNKSINAIEKSMSSFNGLVFVVCQNDLMVEYPTANDLYNVGTLCQIKNVKRMEGYLKVTFTGIDRARMLKLDDTKALFMSNIEVIADVQNNPMEVMALVRTVAKELEAIASVSSHFPAEIVTQLAKGVSAVQLADQFGQHFALPVEKRQALLETFDVSDRLMMVIKELETEKMLTSIEKDINDKVKEKIEENQREYYLREKMRAIKEELGDVSERSDDVDSIREFIEKNPFPENIKAKLRDELTKYEMLPQSGGESGVVRTYIDWLVKLPWWQKTQDNDDIKLVSQRLDEDHFGLEKPKERILEYLAVKQFTKSTSSPIICLIGPPGVGKTSLAKSVARCLDRQFVKISVGGVRDEAEIRGHRRTYLGSMPGKIIQGMKKAGVVNPVFLIDEIDKMGSDYKGDPASAMLEVLDPEQNRVFQDHYLEENYDLSNVLFIATANYIEDIPAALRDRLEIITLSSYTEVEKANIASEHLISKQMNDAGLKKNQIKFNQESLLYLIRFYTREAGVRQLERLIGSICRKTVLRILKGEAKSVTVNKKIINEMLGKEIFDFSKKESKDQVGVATGLAFTQFGGDILPIEVTYYDGKGSLIVTGQLGSVMKESTTVAYGYTKANAKKLNIDPKFFEQHDIQIHVPEGAVPKDGPSAGITITTALISAITNQPIYANVAMTGEVTLRGNVLPIGGLKEKSLAAHRSGIKKILIPKGNLKDLEDIPDVVKDNTRFVAVESIDQVLKEALVEYAVE
jgi:ATP-dependent Lon protease